LRWCARTYFGLRINLVYVLIDFTLIEFVRVLPFGL
jgi:hypothetical protein